MNTIFFFQSSSFVDWAYLLLVYFRGIYMVGNFLVSSVLAEIYFLVSSGECMFVLGSASSHLQYDLE